MKKKFESPYAELSSKIDFLKEDLHIELQYIAERMGVSPSNLTKIRKGLDKRYTEEYIKRLDEAFWEQLQGYGVEKPTLNKIYDEMREIKQLLLKLTK